MIMQGCVISCRTVVFFQKSRNLSRSLLTNNNFYCVTIRNIPKIKQLITKLKDIFYEGQANESLMHCIIEPLNM